MASSISGVTSATQDQFLKLLVAQLQNQDPLSPTDNTAFVAQLAQFSTLQQTTQLNANFGELLKLQQLTQGADLIGKTVQFTPAGGGAATTGKVDSVAVQNGKFVLNVGQTRIGLDQIQTVKS
jgi:flagellar basal-body rod modification protein FlgD